MFKYIKNKQKKKQKTSCTIYSFHYVCCCSKVWRQ